MVFIHCFNFLVRYFVALNDHRRIALDYLVILNRVSGFEKLGLFLLHVEVAYSSSLEDGSADNLSFNFAFGHFVIEAENLFLFHQRVRLIFVSCLFIFVQKIIFISFWI